MNNSQIYVGLDIGTASIKVLVCENVKGKLEVVGVGSHPSGGLSHGAIVDIDKTAQAIKAAVEQAKAKSGVDIQMVTVGLPANYLKQNEVHGMITVADQGQPREISDRDVLAVTQSTLSQALPPEREVIDLVAKDFAVDQFRGIQDPRGMAGVRLELWATLYSGSKTIVHNTKKAVAAAGLKLQDLVVGPMATGFNLLSDGEQDFGTLLMDFGAGQTTTSIIHDHQLKFAFVDPEGGKYVTKDISTVLNTSQKNAERLKLDHGYALASVVKDDVQLAVDVVGKSQPVNYTEKYLAEIIEARLRQIFRRAKDRLDAIGAPELPGGLVLLGGGAAMPGLRELASEYFPGNIRVVVPEQMGIRHPGYATALSLTMYEASLSDVARLIKQTLHDDALIESPSQRTVNQPVALQPAPAKKSKPLSFRRPAAPAAKPATPPSEEVPAPAPTKKASAKNGLRSFFSNFFD